MEASCNQLTLKVSTVKLFSGEWGERLFLSQSRLPRGIQQFCAEVGKREEADVCAGRGKQDSTGTCPRLLITRPVHFVPLGGRSDHDLCKI